MSGSINQDFTIDASALSVPVVTSDAPAEAGYGQTVQIGTIDTADGFNQLSVVFVGNAPEGTLSINAEDQILYTAPTDVLPGEIDNFTYEIEQSTGGISAPVTVSIALDGGPTATGHNFIIGQEGSLDLSGVLNKLATPGLAGDTLTLISASAAQGTIVQQSNGDYVYEPIAGGGSVGNSGGTGAAPATGTDTITYTVADQLGDTVTGTANVTIDPGPILSAGTTFVAPGQSVNLASYIENLIEPGLPRDTETITSVSAQAGQVSAFISTSGQYQVEYTAPIRGSDTITYTVQDQYGDDATGSVTIVTEPSLTATDPSLVIGHAGSIDLSSMASNLATSSVAGDTLTLVSASAAQGTIVQQSNGDYVYEPSAEVVYPGDSGRPTIVPVTGSDTITYKAIDQYGYTVIGTANVTIDPGPVLASGTTVVEPDQRVDLTNYIESLIAPGLPGDTETITAISAETGEIGASTNANGQYHIDYAAPGGGSDTIAFTVQDEYGDKATGTVSVTTDTSLTATDPSLVIGHAGSIDLSGMASNLATSNADDGTVTLISASAAQGTIVQQSNGDYVYEPFATVENPGDAGRPTIVPVTGTDTVTYTAADQYGDTVTGTAAITVDPGPVLSEGSTVVAPGARVDLANYIESLIAPGLPGDTETITAVSAQTGQISAYTNTRGQYQIAYAAPDSGDDTIAYTVQDEYGDKATGTVAVVTDPGPTAGNVLANVTVGQSVDLTQQILGADQAGVAGATLTLTGDNTQGTMGSVSLVNGDLVYTASNAAFAALGSGASTADSFGYTVSDQYGEVAVGTVTLDVSNPATTVNGNPYGGATIEGPAGNATINAFGYSNTIYANGGNDTINAGDGSASVYAGSGNVTVNLNGYGNAVSGGDGTDAVSGGLGNATVTLGNGNDTVNLGGYDNSITVGNGNDTIAAGAGSATVVGGSGTDVVTLQGYQDNVSFTGGNDTITGGAGSDTYDLTGGNASVVLNGYNDMVFLHSTNATLSDVGQGATIQIAGGGTDVLQGAASDPSLVVDLTGGLGGYGSASAVLASLTSDGNGGALLSFGASHGSLDFAGVAPSALHAANFQIG